MGCGTSKKSNKTDMEMELCNDTRIDDLFTIASGPLQTLVEIHKSLSKSEKTLRQATGMSIIRDSTIEDCVFAMLAIYSTPHQGNLSKLSLSLDVEQPFVTVDKESIIDAHQGISNAWDSYIRALIEAPEKLMPLQEQFEAIIDKAKDLPDKAKRLASAAGMGPFQIIKAVKAVTRNCNKINLAPDLIKDTIESLTFATRTLAGLKRKLSSQEEKNRIGEVAKNAFQKKLEVPRDIIVKCWPDSTAVDLALERSKKDKKH